MGFGWRNYGSLLFVSFLLFVCVMVGLVLLIIPGIILLIRLFLAPVAVVVEGKKGPSALSWTWHLTKGSSGKILLTVLLAGLLTWIAATILGFPFGLAAKSLGGNSGDFVDFLGQAFIATVVTPFYEIALLLLYFDLRSRKESSPRGQVSGKQEIVA